MALMTIKYKISRLTTRPMLSSIVITYDAAGHECTRPMKHNSLLTSLHPVSEVTNIKVTGPNYSLAKYICIQLPFPHKKDRYKCSEGNIVLHSMFKRYRMSPWVNSSYPGAKLWIRSFKTPDPELPWSLTPVQ